MPGGDDGVRADRAESVAGWSKAQLTSDKNYGLILVCCGGLCV